MGVIFFRNSNVFKLLLSWINGGMKGCGNIQVVILLYEYDFFKKNVMKKLFKWRFHIYFCLQFYKQVCFNFFYIYLIFLHQRLYWFVCWSHLRTTVYKFTYVFVLQYIMLQIKYWSCVTVDLEFEMPPILSLLIYNNHISIRKDQCWNFVRLKCVCLNNLSVYFLFFRKS